MSSNKVFVGSLAWATTSDSLGQFFAQVGTVVSATVITDKFSGRSKGYGFVEFATEAEAQAAIEQLNNQSLDGREIRVSAALPQGDRSDRKPFGGGGRGQGGGGNRGFHGNRSDY